MKKKILSVLIACFLIGGLLFTVSCQQPSDTGDGGEGKYKIGISLMNRQHAFYNDLEKTFKEEAEKQGVELDIKNAEQDSAKQLDGVETMLIGGIDALILCPVDSSAGSSCVQRANEKGIPVFTVDIKAESGDVVCSIASDNEGGGRMAAEYLAEVLGKKGKLVILDSPEVTSVQERTKGFREVIENYPDMEIVTSIDGGAQREPAMKAMEDALQAHKDIDGVFAINDETAFGALRAIEGANREGIVLVGFDGTQEALDELTKDGVLKADIGQNPVNMAVIALDTVIKHLNGEEVPQDIPIEVTLYTKEILEKGEAVSEETGEIAESSEGDSGNEETGEVTETSEEEAGH